MNPNFFIVGAMKAGTTTLADALAAHPSVFIPPIKEPTYFASDLTSTEWAEWHRRNIIDPDAFVQTDMVKSRRTAIAYVRKRRPTGNSSEIGPVSQPSGKHPCVICLRRKLLGRFMRPTLPPRSS